MGSRWGRHGNTVQPARASRQKQLIFDRRYGWVFEEYTDPIEVAHLGGRGMFSIVPLTSSALHAGWLLANKIADQIVLLILRPKPSLPELAYELQARAGHQLQSIQRYGLQKVEPFLWKWQESLETSRWGRNAQLTLESGQRRWRSGIAQCRARAGKQAVKLGELRRQGEALVSVEMERLQDTLSMSRESLERFSQHTRTQMGRKVPELRVQFDGFKALTAAQLQRLPLLYAALRFGKRPDDAAEHDEEPQGREDDD